MIGAPCEYGRTHDTWSAVVDSACDTPGVVRGGSGVSGRARVCSVMLADHAPQSTSFRARTSTT